MTRPSASHHPANRFFAASVASVLAFSLALMTSSAQGPSPTAPGFHAGKNVDIVGPFGTGPNPVWVQSPQHPGDTTKTYPLFLGDPDKKQQNEPSCDISPTNSLIIFCGMNDYRGVDRPDVVGEPWVGASFSLDGGLSWKSYLHPGFKPKDPGFPIPFNANGYETAADPVVRLVPGLALYNYIAFNRDGTGALLLGRWYERNTEGGFPYEWKDNIEIAKGTGSPGNPGRFLDKPVMKVSLVPGTATYDFNTGVPTGSTGTLIQKVPAGIVHVAYAVFSGNDQQDGTKIIYTRSTTYGDSWSPDTVLSEAQSINQAADIAVDTATNRVVVTWRRFANPTFKQAEAIMFALSTDGGRSFGPPTVLQTICPFTQNTTSKSFRTTTHPFIEYDGTTFHAIWADRGHQQNQCSTTGYSRIVISSLQSNGKWSAPRAVDATLPDGHQFQPGIVAAGNNLLVTWLDTRNDVRNDPNNYPDPDPDPFIDDYFFNKTPPKVRRRSADIFAAQALPAVAPSFGPATQVSRYLFGALPGKAPQQLERNKVNARMFQLGKVPFHGDYIAAAAARWVLKDPIANPGEWVSSAGFAGAQPVFHLAWTDNRLVRGDVSGALTDDSSTTYTPPPLATLGIPDPSTPRGVCTPAAVGTRDQAVFAAGIYPALLLGSSSASKPTADGLVRAYTLFLQNRSLQNRTTENGNALTLSIDAVSVGTASFDQSVPTSQLTGVEVAARSTIARTVFVSSTSPRPIVRIKAFDGGALIGTIYINGNVHVGPLEDPLDPNQRIPDFQIGQVELHTPEIDYRSTSIGVPAIDDPAIDDPAIDDPAIDDPAIDDPAIDDPAIDDPAIDDPAIDDPAIDDPAIDDPAIDDPAIDDPAIDDVSVSASSLNDPDTSSALTGTGQKLTQITWRVVLDGNTSTSMSSKVFLKADPAALAALNAAPRQLLVSRRYRTTDVRGGACTPVRVSNYQVIANVVNPQITNQATPPDIVNPPVEEPSFIVPPGGAVYVTLRVSGDVTGFDPKRVGLIVRSQAGAMGQSEDRDALPVVSVPANKTVEATGPNGATATFDASASDAFDAPLTTTCDGGAVNVEGSVFSVNVPLGATLITCSATDSLNQVSVASFTINVNDSTAPSVTVPPDTTAEATSAAGAAVTYSATATDVVDASPVLTCSPVSGSTFALGSTPVTCTATDDAGNTGSASFNVLVTDTTAPVVTVPQNTVTAEATSAAGAAVTYSATASDVVDASPTVACSPNSGATFAVGTTSVTCTATDDAGNATSASFNVTVTDTTAPVVSVPQSTVTAEATSAAGAVVTYSASATDLVAGSLSPACSPSSGSTFPVGSTLVTCTASDGANTGQATFTVTVRDTSAPQFVGTPGNITNATAGPDGIVITYTDPTATDAVTGSVPVTCSPPSGSVFPVGTTTVTCSASDGATPPNTAQTTFTVTVTQDTIQPAIANLASSPAQLWPPDGAMVPVTVSGTASDAQSGMARIEWAVVDEYGLVQPAGSVNTGNGPFSFTVTLHRYRDGSDKNGRRYEINVVAVDKAGNRTAAKPLIVNVHDQSGK